MRVIICNRDEQFGIASVVRNQINQFIKDKKVSQVIVISPNKLTDSNPKVRYIRIRNYGKFFLTKIPLFFFKAGRIVNRIADPETDVIYTHTPILITRPNLKIISKIHGVHFLLGLSLFKQTPKYWIVGLIQILFSIFDLIPHLYSKEILYVSKKSFDFINKFPFHGNIKYSPNTIDTHIFYPRPKKNALKKINLNSRHKHILYVGRLEPQKGINRLVHIFNSICQKHKNIDLVVVGDGPLKTLLEKNPRIKYFGFQENRNLPWFYSACDLFVMPSLYENCPMTILEAKACNCPTIASNVGDIPYILKKRDIFEPNNSKQMKNKIVQTIFLKKPTSKSLKPRNEPEKS